MNKIKKLKIKEISYKNVNKKIEEERKRVEHKINSELEVVEEDNEIEKLNLPSFEEFKNMSVAERYVVTAKEYDVFNELIDEVNKLKGDKL